MRRLIRLRRCFLCRANILIVLGAGLLSIIQGVTLAAPQVTYRNTGGTVQYKPSNALPVADDLQLTASCGCDATSYSLVVGGAGDGTGTYTATVSLFDGCPVEDGQIIPGTERVFAGIPDNETRELVVDLSASPIPIPGTVWLRVAFDSLEARWITGSQAEIGFTGNFFNPPFGGCNSGLGATLYAGFDAEVSCEETSTIPVAASTPNPPEGAVDVPPNVILNWGAAAQRDETPDESGVQTYEELGIMPQDEVILPEESLAAVRAAIDAGEILDPALRRLPNIAPATPRDRSAAVEASTVTRDDLVLYEDTDGLLNTNFSDGALFNFMGEASNEVLAQHGDNFDFIGFFLNFVPDHQIGGAFYLGLESDVSGIGTGIFENRGNFGVGGVNIEGWVMMWNQANWSPGGTTTRLVLGQEFEHRFGMFLNSLPGGRPIQGDNGACGRGGHWNFRTDGQGSGMEIPEWVGSSPAQRQGGTLNFNTDIGSPGVFSYPDLYLMGYVSPEEMDAGASELRYMDDNANCSSPYNGTISTWSSADLESANGVRNPDSLAAQKNFRTAWVVIHQAGSLPTNTQLDRVASMLNDWSNVFEFSTLGRGTMDNSTVNFVPPCTTLYDVRFGTDDPPTALLCEDVPNTMCDPGILLCNNTYYWQITTKLAGESTLGPVWSFSTPTGAEDCDSNSVIDACDIAGGTAVDCQPDGIPDICQIAPIAPDSADCNTNGIPDACDIASNVLTDTNGNGIADECEVAPALLPAAPHDIRKNRFISFDPNPANQAAAVFRLELLDLACDSSGRKCSSSDDCKACVGGNTGVPCDLASDCSGGTCVVSGEPCVEQNAPVSLGWVDEPVEAGGAAPPGTMTARVVKTQPAARVWTESVVHISDCQIAPVQTYAISASNDGVFFTDPLIVGTIAKPQSKFWADLVGGFDGASWTPPNRLVNVDDVVAMIQFLTLKPAPHITRVDLVGAAPTFTNFIINASDLLLVLKGFAGELYPPPPYVEEGYPADGDLTQCP